MQYSKDPLEKPKKAIYNNLPPTSIQTQTQIKHGQTSKDFVGYTPKKHPVPKQPYSYNRPTRNR